MPAVQPMVATKCDAHRYSTVGTYPGHGGGKAVSHVALLESPERDLYYGQSVTVSHVAPPLQSGANSELNVLGWFSSLKNSEKISLADWISDTAARLPRATAPYHLEHYHLDPAAKEIVKNDGSRYWRFSCAGYVLKCYEAINISIVDLNNLPQIHRMDLEKIYGRSWIKFLLDRHAGQIGKQLGISGTGPWRLLMPGHVINSLARPQAEVKNKPFSPQSVDVEWHWAPGVERP